MQRRDGALQLSATDLANHLGCHYLTWQNLQHADGKLKVPHRKNPVLDRLVERGLLHEQAYVDYLKAAGAEVGELAEFGGAELVEKTLDLMSSGVDVIAQGSLQSGDFGGRADFIIRVDTPSKLGDWSYEVADTKLSQSTKAGTVLQLCLYSEIVGEFQGLMPKIARVVKPGEPFAEEFFRLDDFFSYYRLVKGQLQESLTGDYLQTLYPEPVAQCDVCRWWVHCNDRRREDDHLCFVAGIQKPQIVELARQGINTLGQFAATDDPIKERPKRGSREALEKVHRQSQLQYQSRRSGDLLSEFNVLEESRGFCLLPEPNPGDIYFDLEGDPHAPGGVLEYLFGYVVKNGETAEYHHEWCLDRRSEKNAFVNLMRFLLDRWEEHPDFHIYHYAPYEPSAMKRLAMRYAIYESELDRLLRAEKFVDLYAVTRQGMTLSVERYSIKNLEAFYGYTRLEDLENVRPALNEVERAIELGLTEEIQSSDQDIVRVYNQDDCISTLELQKWLEEKRSELTATGEVVLRPERRYGEPTERIASEEAALTQVFDALTGGIDELPKSDEEQSRWLLAHLLDYFRREEKCVWWEFFRRHDLEPEDLLYEKTAITGLVFQEELPKQGRERNPTHRYSFNPQEESLNRGDQLVEVLGDTVGSVANIDSANGILDIKKTGKAVDIHPTSVFVHDMVRPAPLPESLLEFGRTVAENKDNLGVVRSARYDILAKASPRLKSLKLPIDGPVTEVATQIAFDLDDSILPIQGPPGAGKTFVGSHMIAELAKAGKRIGVTAISHKVISNLLLKASERLEDTGLTIAHRVSKRPEDYPETIEILKNTDAAVGAVSDGKIVGGTAWLWANAQLENQLDYLFIDEAGQMSLAIALAATRAAKNVILLGDPQQLEQPQLGTHPEGADAAVLTHLLDGRATIPAERGLFLEKTWRLHPDLCRFTSEQFYDGRLNSREGLEAQVVIGESLFAGSGLRYVPVEHEGNQNRSYEEIEAIGKILEKLLDGNHSWSDDNGAESKLTADDILIVAPYNAQVNALQRELEGRARIGTVDKFQGQEAPIVIYSTTSSSAEEAPRGMSFLYNPNRLNVATSRAKCVAIIVGSPRLVEPECRTPEQIKLANGLCRFRELSTD